MAPELVTTERFEAGGDYLAALAALGFEPEGAFWSVRTDDEASLELSLLYSVVERLGSRRVFDALFEAFEHAKTPRNFDPWQVGLYSPNQLFYHAFNASRFFDDSKAEAPPVMNVSIKIIGKTQVGWNKVVIGGRESSSVERIIHAAWVYRKPSEKTPKMAVIETQIRRFQSFEAAVSEAA